MATATLTAPLLENGARMDRAEFHRRYLQCPDLHGVELIEGVVYMPSPTKTQHHGLQQTTLLGWLIFYELRHPGVRACTPATVLLDGHNEVEPDAMLMRISSGLINHEGYTEGAPELVVEIANSSVSKDLHQKKTAYERNGVRDYIVWRVQDGKIDWFELRDGQFRQREPDADGIIESATFPGLRLNVAKALADDLAGVVAEIR